jgi:ribosomal protein L37E
VGAALPSGRRFCVRCGAALASTAQFCPACGWPRNAPYPSARWAAPGAVPFAGPTPPGTVHSDDSGIILLVVVVVVLLVVVPVALAAFLFFDVTHAIGPGPIATPIGTAFAAGDPTSESCTTAMVSDGACVTEGDFVYSLSVEQSTVAVDNVIFLVDTATGATFHNTATAWFAVVPPTGYACAYAQIASGAGLATSGTWTGYGSGCFASSPLLNTMKIVIDLGQTAPTTGSGLNFVVAGENGYDGTTAPLVLP